jgi:hypothetical protein
MWRLQITRYQFLSLIWLLQFGVFPDSVSGPAARNPCDKNSYASWSEYHDHLVTAFGTSLRCDCHKDASKPAVTSIMYYFNDALNVNVTFVFHHRFVAGRYPIGWGHPSVLTAPKPGEMMW